MNDPQTVKSPRAVAPAGGMTRKDLLMDTTVPALRGLACTMDELWARRNELEHELVSPARNVGRAVNDGVPVTVDGYFLPAMAAASAEFDRVTDEWQRRYLACNLSSSFDLACERALVAASEQRGGLRRARVAQRRVVDRLDDLPPGMKHIQLAVFRARQRRLVDDKTLAAAGFNPGGQR